MKLENKFDVIIVGGSYSGLAAAMALARALKRVLVIDAGQPCNRQTPYSHNFLTHDGHRPADILAAASREVRRYETIEFFSGLATNGSINEAGIHIGTAAGETFVAKHVLFATGIRDVLPEIEGLPACWGISALHCPYCHGYEVRGEKTGVLGNGAAGFDFVRLISNWAGDLSLFTNGPSTLTVNQTEQLLQKNIKIIEKELKSMEHTEGRLRNIQFKDGAWAEIPVLYAPVPFEQHCKIPETLGCARTEDGYIQIDQFYETTVPGVYAVGDNASRMRTVANAVAMGTAAGIGISKKMILLS